MAAVVTPTRRGNARAFPITPSPIPSEKDNSSTAAGTGGSRRAGRNKITSRYLSSSLLSSSNSNSSSISTICSSPSPSSSSFTPRHSPSPVHTPPPKTPSEPATSARAALRTTTRSLSVSFQGETFFFQTSKDKPSPRKPAPKCRKPNAAAAENEKASAREPSLVASSLDCSANEEDPILVTVRLLKQSLVFDSHSHNSDKFSSGSNSSLPEPGVRAKVRAKPLGICVPVRFRQENCRPRYNAEAPMKLVTGKQQAMTKTTLASSRFVPSSLYGSIKSSSPIDVGASSIRSNIMERYSNGSVGNVASIISFASEVRRTKKGESRIKEAHLLRMFHNRYLQWRYINARAGNTLSAQLFNTKNNLRIAWITISEFLHSTMNKRIKLQVMMQNLKLASILKGQAAYLDEWSTVDKDHESSLRGAVEALKASTLRFPVAGAKVDIKEVKDAVSSAIVVMQTMMASINSVLSKIEEINSLVCEVGKAGTLERSLLNQSKDHLSVFAALHVKQCSLRGYMLQLRRKTSLIHLQ